MIFLNFILKITLICLLIIVTGLVFGEDTRHPNKKSVLLVIDVQNCFIEEGSLAVSGGRSLVPFINHLLLEYRPYFEEVIFTKDYHPRDHVSFASQHFNKSAFQKIKIKYDENEQTLWPDHCIENTQDSEFPSDLNFDANKDVVFKKATNKDIDSYSVFMDNGHISKTNLDEMLKSKQIKKIFMVGIATDYCVKNSAIDAKDLGNLLF
ncbi:hypothetical protein HELRODRAFT_71735 [Helobdella robusta]|uniref:nicotinamidase n=1 Tax=Helobdella robusta TaxID=6412 RepID=T1G0R0_HELRO|nr:hypothetical protein HELRODRAFT_71735 [Helobdella robusta]ESO11816.1 hypothetical protein HELRODRAFT_71735 [Helobdella robusta]